MVNVTTMKSLQSTELWAQQWQMEAASEAYPFKASYPLFNQSWSCSGREVTNVFKTSIETLWGQRMRQNLMFCKHVTNFFLYCYSSSPEPTHTCWILKWKRRDKVSKTISFRHMCTSHTLNNTVQRDLMPCYGGPTLPQIKPSTKSEYVLFGEHWNKVTLYTLSSSSSGR